MKPVWCGPTAAYIAPFVAFIAAIAIERTFGISPQIGYPMRVVLALAAFLLCSRGIVRWRPSYPALSILVGIVVFVIWIGPDVLFGPGYRHSRLFENGITGAAVSSLSPDLRHNTVFLVLRVLGSVALVPLIEELFWRGWLMRWLIHPDFQKVPLGAYAARAFWIVALLFASEHGPYWEVGLAAGVVYNLLVIRTRNLADCILAHALTNTLLAAYVLGWGRWQYWL